MQHKRCHSALCNSSLRTKTCSLLATSLCALRRTSQRGIFYLMLCCCAGCSVKTKTKAIATTSTTCTHTTALSAAKTLHFKVLGKASLSDGKRHAQISLRWQQRGEHYIINLYGPLGSGAVRLSNTHSHLPASSTQSAKHSRSGRSVYYQDMKGELRSYGSAETLLEQECGWRLPISGLVWWLRGLPRPEETAIIVRDKAALITQIAQDGWTIQYLSYQSIKGKTYPHKVHLSRDKRHLKFVLRDWHIDTETQS